MTWITILGGGFVLFLLLLAAAWLGACLAAEAWIDHDQRD